VAEFKRMKEEADSAKAAMVAKAIEKVMLQQVNANYGKKTNKQVKYFPFFPSCKFL